MVSYFIFYALIIHGRRIKLGNPDKYLQIDPEVGKEQFMSISGHQNLNGTYLIARKVKVRQ